MLIACCTAIAYFKACLTIFKMFALLEPAECMQYLLRMQVCKNLLKNVFDVATSTFISNTVRTASFAGFFLMSKIIAFVCIYF